MKHFHCFLVIVTGCYPVSSFVLPSSTIHRVRRPSSIGTTPPALPFAQHKPHPKAETSLSMMKLPSSFLTNRGALHGDPSFVLSAILLLSTFGIALEKRTVVGKALSAPLATMALALMVANLGLVPFTSPVCKLFLYRALCHCSYSLAPLYADTMINRFLVPLAVPMLLFDSDLKRVVSDTGSLLLAFFVGAIATIVGTLVAYPLLPLTSLGPDVGWRVACALAARHIGGAINFVAVADTLNVGGSAVSAAIAADNVVVALYFVFLFSISKQGTPSDAPEGDASEITVTDPGDIGSADDGLGDSTITLSSLGTALSVASCLVTAGGILTRAILPAGTSSLPLTSSLTVLSATLFPKFFSRIGAAGTAVGITFIQMFFAASGAAGSIQLVLKSAPSLFLFSALQIGVHFGTLMALGRGIFRLPPRELYLASNANVGGPTTAAAMAQAKDWKRLVLPALLIGILGYATATAIALALGPVLLRLPLVGR